MPPKVSEMCEYIHSISDFGTDSDYLRDVEAKWVSLRALSVSTLKHLFHDYGVANTISTDYKYNIENTESIKANRNQQVPNIKFKTKRKHKKQMEEF